MFISVLKSLSFDFRLILFLCIICLKLNNYKYCSSEVEMSFNAVFMKSRCSFKTFLTGLYLFCIVTVSAQTSLIDSRAKAVYNTFKSCTSYTTVGMNARHGSQAAAVRLKANNGND